MLSSKQTLTDLYYMVVVPACIDFSDDNYQLSPVQVASTSRMYP